jgi:hypothetical protein
MVRLRIKDSIFQVPAGMRLDTACLRAISSSKDPEVTAILRHIGMLGFKKARGMEAEKIKVNGTFVEIDIKINQDCEISLS